MFDASDKCDMAIIVASNKPKESTPKECLTRFSMFFVYKLHCFFFMHPIKENIGVVITYARNPKHVFNNYF